LRDGNLTRGTASCEGNLSLRRRSRLAPAAIAVLCVFTIVAGLTVTRLLPGRLALWRPPGIAAGRLAGSAQVLGAAAASGRASATASGVARTLTPVISSASFGQRLGVLVADLPSGQVLYGSNASTGFAPASTTKLATAIAAIQALGPTARFTTTVVAAPDARSIVLVGGGDPTLAAGPLPAADYPQPATLLDLAHLTAQALKARGRHSVRVGYDTSLYSGPAFAPGWPGSYVSTGNVSAITSLAADQGRVTANGTPADTNASNGLRAADPAAVAAASFARFLAADGIAVRSGPAPGRAPAGAATLASVQSPPLTQVVQWMLEESNNVIAENLARHVAIAVGQQPSFNGGAVAETSVLRRLGITGELTLFDGSGLSPDNRIAPVTLVELVRLAASHRQFRPVLTGLPVEGFSGTLALGGSVFGLGGASGLGVVRAKTGNLGTVAALAGTAYDSNGQLFAFAVMADQISAAPGALGRAATAMVNVASALAGCGCR
jgi:D-alanyl-D-alanine carboxypeptidase/D-alanyl-D-alanine-endopeptidase (penicillin-binding protein 4)